MRAVPIDNYYIAINSCLLFGAQVLFWAQLNAENAKDSTQRIKIVSLYEWKFVQWKHWSMATVANSKPTLSQHWRHWTAIKEWESRRIGERRPYTSIEQTVSKGLRLDVIDVITYGSLECDKYFRKILHFFRRYLMQIPIRITSDSRLQLIWFRLELSQCITCLLSNISLHIGYRHQTL